ncbi:MAG: hypothetical protein KIT84_18695 [Labilithrix sp.]|nr:hypothetical protein [Labilithrix sp.]MCW5813063.1 hypothetical protein [Labilithrix sp.]
MSTTPFDFEALEEHLFDGCAEAIASVQSEIGREDPAVFFAIDANPYYGEFLPSLDTRSNAAAVMKGHQASVLERRAWLKDTSDEAWKNAHEHARFESLPLYNHEVADFSHHMLADLKYAPLASFVRDPIYATLNATASKDGWVEGHTRAVLARVVDRLVDGGHFASLPIAAPFGVGYAYHGEPMIVCRVVL